LLPVDKWIIARTDDTVRKAAKLLSEYEIGSARHEIDELFWKDLCDNYIEIAKERLYRPDIRGENEHRSGQYALYYTLLNILKLYAIYVPHITEYIYQEFFKQYEKEKSIHLTRWVHPGEPDAEILAFGETLKDAVAEMRKYKSENHLSMIAAIDTMSITAPANLLPLFTLTEADLLACSGAKRIEYR
jgi:valyl-tRNA synthetase